MIEIPQIPQTGRFLRVDEQQVKELSNLDLAELLDESRFSNARRAWLARREAARRLRLLGQIGPS